MADKSFEEMLDRAVSSRADKGFSLKEEEQISIKQLIQGGDLLAVLPNGFGKSLIFQMLALMKNKSCLLIICPLQSIMHDHRRGSRGGEMGEFSPLLFLSPFFLSFFFSYPSNIEIIFDFSD